MFDGVRKVGKRSKKKISGVVDDEGARATERIRRITRTVGRKGQTTRKDSREKILHSCQASVHLLGRLGLVHGRGEGAGETGRGCGGRLGGEGVSIVAGCFKDSLPSIITPGPTRPPQKKKTKKTRPQPSPRLSKHNPPRPNPHHQNHPNQPPLPKKKTTHSHHHKKKKKTWVGLWPPLFGGPNPSKKKNPNNPKSPPPPPPHKALAGQSSKSVCLSTSGN